MALVFHAVAAHAVGSCAHVAVRRRRDRLPVPQRVCPPQNLDPSQLDIGILSGAVRLEKLELNPQGLAFLQLPVDIKDGARQPLPTLCVRCLRGTRRRCAARVMTVQGTLDSFRCPSLGDTSEASPSSSRSMTCVAVSGPTACQPRADTCVALHVTLCT